MFQDKKEKPAGPPPFEHLTASRYLLSGDLCGISLCFELNHLLEGHEKLFGVIFTANIALGNSLSSLFGFLLLLTVARCS